MFFSRELQDPPGVGENLEASRAELGDRAEDQELEADSAELGIRPSSIPTGDAQSFGFSVYQRDKKRFITAT